MVKYLERVFFYPLSFFERRCNMVFRPSIIGNIALVNFLENKGTRLQKKADVGKSNVTLFIKLKSLTVSDINFPQISFFMYRINLVPISYSQSSD